MRKHEFMFSGIGGQGVISIGELLCMTAVAKGLVVTFTPSYGQEKRGGRTMCQMVVSDKMGSHVISEAGLLLVMDERSLTDYEGMVAKGGTLILNSDLIQKEPARTDINVVKIPCNTLATEAGSGKAANMVALGAALRVLTFVTLDEVKAGLPEIFPGGKAKLIPVNERALDMGYEAAK
ncbi:MAG TPA: 2-oxoacid:acceptor oxidoreductase family protein [Terriglobales bacterium]|nr:2-oxoacid:acceptor oxidoreductase family protein [Terriglobales bacterium]